MGRLWCLVVPVRVFYRPVLYVPTFGIVTHALGSFLNERKQKDVTNPDKKTSRILTKKKCSDFLLKSHVFEKKKSFAFWGGSESLHHFFLWKMRRKKND